PTSSEKSRTAKVVPNSFETPSIEICAILKPFPELEHDAEKCERFSDDLILTISYVAKLHAPKPLAKAPVPSFIALMFARRVIGT
ncbi:hypothetical protein ACC695_39470, partial [Rhizobium ruizarguesonis]